MQLGLAEAVGDEAKKRRKKKVAPEAQDATRVVKTRTTVQPAFNPLIAALGGELVAKFKQTDYDTGNKDISNRLHERENGALLTPREQEEYDRTRARARRTAKK